MLLDILYHNPADLLRRTFKTDTAGQLFVFAAHDAEIQRPGTIFFKTLCVQNIPIVAANISVSNLPQNMP